MSTETNVVPLVFQGVSFDVVDRNGDPWLRGSQVASALGSTNPGRYISELYERNADEFTDEMTSLVRLQTEGGEQEVRIFSPRGCYALAMFARTDPAKAFRVWVMDVLESVRKTGQYNAKPNPVAQIDAEIAAAVENMVKALEQANATVAQGKETVKLLVTERRLTLQQEATRQKLLEKAQTKLLLKETEEMTIAEIRQQELLEALRIGKKSALAYQEATGIPIPTTLRDLKKLREQGHDVQVQDTIYGMLYGLFVGGKLMRNYLPED